MGAAGVSGLIIALTAISILAVGVCAFFALFAARRRRDRGAAAGVLGGGAEAGSLFSPIIGGIPRSLSSSSSNPAAVLVAAGMEGTDSGSAPDWAFGSITGLLPTSSGGGAANRDVGAPSSPVHVP